MNDGFRQRMLGALVLICVGVIAWPLLFSDQPRLAVDRRSQIPAAPAFEKFELPAPQRPEQISPAPALADTDAAQVDVLVSELPAQPQLDSRGLPEAWALQVASFSQRDNAEQLKQRLLAQGYKAYIAQVSGGDGIASRVLIGPYMDKSLLAKYKKKIDSELKVQSLVVRFAP